MIKATSLIYVLAIITLILLADHSEFPCWLTWYKWMPYGDTVGHFFLFGAFSLAVTMGLRFKRITVFSKAPFLGSIITFLFVTTEEISQQFIACRNFSLLDLSANYLGILVIGQLLGLRLTKHFVRNPVFSEDVLKAG